MRRQGTYRGMPILSTEEVGNFKLDTDDTPAVLVFVAPDMA
jgi:hypothetical protein